VVLYAMLYGTVPFKASNMTELQRQICKGATTFKDEISPESINLLQAILEKDPKKRITIDQILRHPWMQNIPKNSKTITFNFFSKRIHGLGKRENRLRLCLLQHEG